jgi:predicted amidohydrolase
MGLALVAVQARLEPGDVEGADAFRAKMAALAAAAAERAGGAADRLLVFPEHLGLAALAAGMPAAARRRGTLDGALAAAAARSPVAIASALVAQGSPLLRRAALLALAPGAQALLHETFAVLARRHRATIVAGSGLRVGAGGRLTNGSITYGPDGRPRAVAHKVNLVPGVEDASTGGMGLSRGDAADVAAIDAGWGRLVTLIGYDAFAAPHTADDRFAGLAPSADALDADVIANPAACRWPWSGPWPFGGGGGASTVAERWLREGPRAALAGLGHVRHLVTAHLVGAVLDHRFEGRSEILARDRGEVRSLACAERADAEEIVAVTVTVDAAAGAAGAGS